MNFNFAMIYIIHKILVFVKNHLNYLNDNTLECFFKKYNLLYFLQYYNLIFFFDIFSQYIMMKYPRPEKEKIIKDVKNPFRLKKKN